MPRRTEGAVNFSKKIPEKLIGSTIYFSFKGKDIPVNLINTGKGHSTVKLREEITSINGKLLEIGQEIIVSNQEICFEKPKKTKLVKYPKSNQKPVWNWYGSSP